MTISPSFVVENYSTMRHFFIVIQLLLSGISALPQEKISGFVKDLNDEALIGANVYVKGSYDGAITDTLGHFSFKTNTNDSSVLVVSYIGYKTFQEPLINLKDKQVLTITLEEITNNVDEVIITAGSFEAGEKSRAVLLSPVEIATTASSDGDVYGALKTFPGVQKQGETGKIIVRGGDNNESKTYMDGLLVSSPYTSSMPDLPSRGRFTPFMFNGIMFSTGGYSAEYGQALSSVLELKTPGLFEEDLTSVSLMNVGAGLSHTRCNDKSAYSGELNYNNLYPYFLLAKHELEWLKIPQNFGSNFYHRRKIGKTGMIKTDATYSHSSSRLDYSNLSSGYDEVGMKTDNLFLKTGYNTELSKKWLLKIGIAYNKNKDFKELDADKLTEKLGTIHSRLGLVNYYNENITFKFGAELYSQDSRLNFFADSTSINYKLEARDLLTSGFIESDIRLTKNTALRIGGRGEYLVKASKPNLSPRVSLAQKISKTSQVSIAWGEYYQQANTTYLHYNQNLDFEKATHFIANYQVQAKGRSFRTEIYYKKYKNLITFEPAAIGQYQNLQNKGFGYAKGLDLFWKDDKTLKYATYWISYSYIDSKRKYKDYEESVTPDFVTAHNLSLVLKYWIQPVNTQACLTYNYTSGRPYNNPNKVGFMSEKTASFHDLSGNLSYITNLFGYFTVVHLSVSNILGIKNTYTYRYNQNPDANGNYTGYPVSAMVQRTIILGVFISIK